MLLGFYYLQLILVKVGMFIAAILEADDLNFNMQVLVCIHLCCI
jgi:hypothetical protein